MLEEINSCSVGRYSGISVPICMYNTVIHISDHGKVALYVKLNAASHGQVTITVLFVVGLPTLWLPLDHLHLLI